MYALYKYRKGKLILLVSDIPTIEKATKYVSYVRQSNRDSNRDIILVENTSDRIVDIYYGSS